MPIKPGASETQEEFISRCIGEEIKAGYEQSQAAAICYSKWDRKELSKQKFSDPLRRVQSKLNFEKKYEGINLQEPAEGLEDACWEGYVAVGLKPAGDGSGRMVPNCVPIEEEASKVEMELEKQCMCNLAEYDWDTCVLEQTDRYGSKDIAEKICGTIRSKYGS